jgi:TetR/AcrR family transcriptional regulator, acrAB operon repressor
MPRKPATQQFDTLKAIRNHAFTLFGRFGYEGVSIGDIARHARLSKGALYWHFRGKDALYLDCLQRLHAIFNECIFDPMRAETQAVPRILLLYQGLARLAEDPRVEKGVAGYWMIPSSAGTEPFVAAQRAFEAESVTVIEQTLQLGVQQGRFDFGDDLEDMAQAIISLVEAVVPPMRHQSREEVRRNLGVLARTLFRAYATPTDLLELTRAI